MSYKIEDIEGIGPAYAEKLRSAGIDTTEDLLKTGACPKCRRDLAEKTEISPKFILTWVMLADLMRIKGGGGQFAELLEAAGVDTVRELAHRNAENLHTALEAKNAERKLVGRVPSLAEVERMIAQAKELPGTITY